MSRYTMFNYDFICNDHFAKVSKEAKLYYFELMFNANCGFVANPIKVLDSMGYDKSVLQELINNGEILTLKGRDEVFITAYYIHNHNFNVYAWLRTPFAQYWKGKLFIKRNGVATFNPEYRKKEKAAPNNKTSKELIEQEEELVEESTNKPSMSWDEMCDTVEELHNA